MKKALKIILPLLLAVLICAGAAWYLLLYRPSLTADYYVSRAETAIANGRYDRAITLYTKADELGGSDIEILSALANAYKQSGNYTKSEYTLVRAISAFPEELSLYIALSRVYVEQDKLLDAEQMLSRVANDSIRAQLTELRPEAPVLTPESGYYNDYIDVSVSYSGGSVYLMTGGEYPSLTSPYTGPITLERGETVVSAIVVSDDGLVSPLTTGGYTIGQVDEPVTFVDAALEATVRELLEKAASDTIMSSELWTITELTLPDDIASLEDLVWFESLESLSGSDLHGIDLSPIASLSSLRRLALSNSGVSASELEAIGSMTGLISLDLSGCGLSSVASLSQLTNLEELLLSDNSIGNITPLEDLSKLTTLDLSNNAVTSLAVLVDLRALTWLSVANNPIDSLTPAAGCTALEYLDLTNCGISDLSAVSGMTALAQLNASGNQIADISVLSNCTALSVLDLSSNQITDADALGGLLALTQVQLDYNELTTLPTFSADCAMYDFSASHNALTDISGLAPITALNYVDIDYNDVRDITVLSDCLNLIQVQAFANPITEVQELVDHGIIVNYDPTYIDTYESDEE